MLLTESLINASSLISRIKTLQKEQFFYNVIFFKSRNPTIIKTIPNGIVPNFFKFFMIYNCFVFGYYNKYIIFKMF
jgi:hypothetical protein